MEIGGEGTGTRKQMTDWVVLFVRSGREGSASLLVIFPQAFWTACFLQEPSAWMPSFIGAFIMMSTACTATLWQEPQTRKHLVFSLILDLGSW